jgi:hypothetical protein
VKCNLSGKSVCTRCLRHGLQCQYGYANRSGKPKGSKNRATLRKLGQLQEEKPAMRGFRNSRLVAPVADMESLGSSYGGHIPEPALDEEVGPPYHSLRLIQADHQPGLFDIQPSRLLGKSPKLRQHCHFRVLRLPGTAEHSRKLAVYRPCGCFPIWYRISTHAGDANISVRGVTTRGTS